MPQSGLPREPDPRRAIGIGLLWALGLIGPALAATGEPPSPEGFLGRRLGEDRYLAPYPKVVEYFHALDAASERVSVQVAGKSTLGNDMLLVILTSEDNQRELDRYREIARRLANPDDLTDQQAASLIGEGRTIILVTCTIHATEVGSTQMSMELAHQIATTTDPDKLAWLDDVILLMMPSINPDGQILVIDWYNKYLGTEFEGGSMPWLYHHYVGHDNNRDFYMLTQKETEVVNRILYHDWFPQVFLDEHQMGGTGPRMFVPPQTDPLAPEVHSMIFRMGDLLGTSMGMRLEEAGKTGVGNNMIYDSYWPGGTRNTAWWKNVIGLLTEVASARIASPVYIEPGELEGGLKGFPEYQRRANYPSPWSGGWWRLRDIMDYELIATNSLLESGSRYRRELLTTFYKLNREEIEKGRSEPPHAFLVPAEQHDPVASALMIDLLLRHGVRVHVMDAAHTLGQTTYPAGTYVIPASQPYRPFLLTMLRPQRYPEILSVVGGPILEPYDHTSWSLPIGMGVTVVPIESRGDLDDVRLHRIEEPAWPGGAVREGRGGYLIPHAADSAYTLMNRLLVKQHDLYWLSDQGGDIYVPAGQLSSDEMEEIARDIHVPVKALGDRPTGRALKVHQRRVGLYKPWVASMDEGWTRFLLEKYEFPFVTITNEEIRDGGFRKRTDVLLLPDVGKSILKDGKPAGEAARRFTPLPPEYSGGLDKKGGDEIKKWVQEEGGAVVALNSSSDYLIELLELPVTNVLENVPRSEFSCPGSMLRLLVDTTQPIAYGMRPEEAGFFDQSPAFETWPPDPRFRRRVVASYPEHGDQILLSGFIEGEHLLEKRAAVVDLHVGKGRVVLLGIRAQHRAQPHRTFKLLFNSIYSSALEDSTL